MLGFKRKKINVAVEETIPKSYLEAKASSLEVIDEIERDLYTKYDVKRGLRNANGTGVLVGLTKIGDVHGYSVDEAGNKVPEPGQLYYRGYEIQTLVNNYIQENRFGFEEVSYLLIFGELPTRDQLDSFKKLLGEHRILPPGFARDMILTAPSSNIMNKLARSVLAMYCYDDNPDDTSIENVLRQSIGLMGNFPALMAYGYQAKVSFYENRDLHLNNPDPNLSTAENILRMLRPNGEYTDIEAKVLDLCLIIHAEHGGGNNSTFTTHLVSSSGTDTYSAIASAIGSLKGPKHGGANISVLGMMEDLKKNIIDYTNRNAVDAYLRDVLLGKANDGSGLIYGMGHAIYTISDPRAQVLKRMARKLAEEKGLMKDFELCEYIELNAPRIYKEVKGVDKVMCANVDLYSGFVYTALGIPSDLSTPLFALARLSGWSAHRIEELVTGKKIMRPAYKNVQVHKHFVPIGNRTSLSRKTLMDTHELKELAKLKELNDKEIAELRNQNKDRLREVRETSDRILDLKRRSASLEKKMEMSKEMAENMGKHGKK